LIGDKLEDAMRNASTERFEQQNPPTPDLRGLAARMVAFGKACAALPRVDERSDDEIAGYDETGLWR
jgi:hypothetical protein